MCKYFWRCGSAPDFWGKPQCCGSKYIEFGSGSRVLAQFGSGSRVMLSILKKKIILEKNYFFIKVYKAPEYGSGSTTLGIGFRFESGISHNGPDALHDHCVIK